MLFTVLWLAGSLLNTLLLVQGGVEQGLPIHGSQWLAEQAGEWAQLENYQRLGDEVWGAEQEEEYRIMDALSGLKRKIVGATSQLDEIDAESGASSKTKQALRLEQLDLTFQAIASGVEDLETIERQVETSTELPLPIKEQVGWNLRKMKVDVQRLQGSALDPSQREAIEKALELRFSVLLSPAFWQHAVDRSLLA
jgi:hypothetical protein